MPLGIRVSRGPDWVHNEDDGGEGHLGTVVGVKIEEGTAEVVWDNGQVTTCRVGKEGKHDLRIYDNATIGVRHPDVTCAGCLSPCIWGIRWHCALCPQINLCSRCYVIGVHDVKHPFLRFTTPSDQGVTVGRRSDDTRVRLQGLFLGARVVRGPDWQSGDADGGAGTRGVVVEVVSPESGSARNAVRVSWDSGQSLQHRLGLHGKVDLVCTEEAPGPACYVSHLPVLASEHLANTPAAQLDSRRSEDTPKTGLNVDHSTNSPTTAADSASSKDKVLTDMEKFKVGDTVRIISDVKLLERQQKDHGGWNPALAQTAGKAGTVIRITDKGDLMVMFGQQYGVFNRRNCAPAPNASADFLVTKEFAGALDEIMTGPFATLSGQLMGTLGDARKLKLASVASSPTLAALCAAVTSGDMKAADQLLLQNPTLVHETFGAGTALHYAAYNGKPDGVRLLVKRGADVNKGDKDDDTPLLCALRSPHVEVAKALIELGADVNLSNENGRTPLHLGVSRNSPEVIRLLLQHQAAVNRRDIRGDTPLHDTMHESRDPQITDALLAATDLDLTVTNKQGLNVLHLAAQKNSIRATEKILAMNPTLAAIPTEEEMFTPLHIATLNNHVEIIKLLIKANVPLDAQNNIGQTALSLACRVDLHDAAELLVNSGADINKPDQLGDTPLHACVVASPLEDLLGLSPKQKRKSLKTAILLIQRGARTDIRNHDGKTPLEAASSDVRPQLEGAIKQAREAGKTRNSKVQGQTEVSSKETTASVKCVMCHQKEPDVIFLPCAHKVLCRQCAGSIKNCPSCDRVVERTIDREGKPVERSTTSAAQDKAGTAVQECKVQ